ncbi:hypothetical protein D1BOALGB6SA_3631 [Olavius sp. associated proteobacterium Delta 1]|nr:hypothetical protein D1BOALGB6SA_3631 [Olavius sp. associated proteobacterium Delta 1]
MLTGAISKANLKLKDARQHLTTQAADAVERVLISVENLNNFINKEMDRIEKDPELSYRERRTARRGVFEQAGRKLEILKARSNYSNLIQESGTEIPDTYEKDDNALLKFMREREIRDRLFGMTEAQILSHFGESLFDGRNQLLLNAILNAPPGFEMLSEQNLRKLRRIKAKSLTQMAGAEPELDRFANASIVEIFRLAKKELDRLRKNELAGNRPKKN